MGIVIMLYALVKSKNLNELTLRILLEDFITVIWITLLKVNVSLWTFLHIFLMVLKRSLNIYYYEKFIFLWTVKQFILADHILVHTYTCLNNK